MSSIQKKAPPFLIKTYEMLENQQYFETIRWNEEENGFIIQDVQSFSSTILPAYFKHKNMHSYIRQLNMYGFSKKRGKTNNYYYHPCFVRKQPELISQIQRRVQNKTPKPFKTSTASIDQEISEQPHLALLKFNQLLLLEQFANLKLILDEVVDRDLSQGLSAAASKYFENQNKLLQKLSGVKEKDILITANTLEDVGESVIQGYPSNYSD